MLRGAVEPSWPTCLSHMSILLERARLCSLYPCDIFLPLLCVSPYSPPDLWLFLPDSTTFTILILHSSASCHSHPFHTSHLIISALFLSLTITPLHFPPQFPKTHLHSPSICSQMYSAHLHPQLPQHCLPHTWLSLPTFSPPIFKLFRRAWSHQKRFCPFRGKSA